MIETTSRDLVKLATEKLAVNEDSGYINVPDKPVIRAMIAALRRFPQQIAFKVVDRGTRSGKMQQAMGLASKAINLDDALQVAVEDAQGKPGPWGRRSKAQHDDASPSLQGN